MSNKSPTFFPQGLLIYKLVYGSDSDPLKKSNIGQNGNTYVNVAKLEGDYKPEIVISKLVSTDGKKVDNNLLNLENHKISALVPEVRLYRVVETEEQKVIPFYFPVGSEYNFDSDGKLNLSEKSFSAGAAVIENFSYSLTGANPYQISRKFLNANLKIKVDNLSVLFNEKKDYAVLADLFTIRAGAAKSTYYADGNKEHAGDALSNGQSCRIVATIGYSVPRNYDIFTSEEIITIEQTKQVLNLYYSGHDLNVQNDGTTDVSIKYTGYLESFKDNGKYDFLKDATSKAYESQRETKIKKAAESIRKALNKENKKENAPKPNEEESKKRTQQDNQDAFGILISDLWRNKRIHRTNFTEEYYNVFNNKPGNTKAQKKQKEPKSLFGVFDNHPVYYFTFGDFVDAYFKKIGTDLDDAIKKSKEKKKEDPSNAQQIDASITNISRAKDDLKLINILMCSVRYNRKRPEGGSVSGIINIADIPISLDNFYTRVYKEITLKTEGSFNMENFLGFSLGLLKDSLNELQAAKLIDGIDYNTSSYTSRKLKQKINRGVIDIRDTSPSTGAFTKSSIQKLSEYFIFHQLASVSSKSVGGGNRNSDSNSGMFHLKPNKDRGFLKNVSFSKISQPAREASLVVGATDLYDELRLPHDATATMYGNFMFMPGSSVYVDPNSLGFGSVRDLNSAARRLGFGGYYTVVGVNTSYAGGKLETTLNMKFNSFPDKEGDQQSRAGFYKAINDAANIGRTS